MKFTDEPPYSLGQLACIINDTIDVLKLPVSKLNVASLSQANNALIGRDNGYRSSLKLADQWQQLVDIFGKLGIDEKTREKILKLADQKDEHFKFKKEMK